MYFHPFFASCNQGCDLKNRLTIGKFMIDTLNNSKKMDDKTYL